MSDNKKPGSNRDWGYASYYDDPKTGETRLIYTSIENDGRVNRYKDNGDGGHSHSTWNKKDDYDYDKEPDWKREESNDSPNPDTGQVQDNGGCYLTTACMHKYKNNFDDNCYELTTLRWFRDKFVSLPDKYHYYKVAPKIVEGIEKTKNKKLYYNSIYNGVIKPCIRMIENKEYKQAYERYKYTVKLLENKFVNNTKNIDIGLEEKEILEIDARDNNL